MKALINKVLSLNYCRFADNLLITGCFVFALGVATSKTVFTVGMVMVFVSWLIYFISDRSYRKLPARRYWPFLLLLLVIMISRNDFWYILESHVGTKLPMGMLFFLVLWKELPKHKKYLKLLLASVILSLIACAAVGYHQYFNDGIRRADGLVRFSLTYGNVMGMGVGLVLPFLFWRNIPYWQRISAGALSIFFAGGVLISLSRGAILALVGTLGALMCYRSWKLLPVFLVLCLLVFYTLPQNYQDRIMSTVDIEGSHQARIGLWKASVNMFLDHPIRGVGMDRFQEYLEADYMNEYLRSSFLHPHNNFFHMAAEFGIFGFVLFVYILYILLVRLYGRFNNFHPGKDNFYRAAITGVMGAVFFFILHGLTHNNILDYVPVHFFWFLVALGLTLEPLGTPKGNEAV